MNPQQRMAQGYAQGPDGKARRRLAAVQAVHAATAGLDATEVAALHREIAALQPTEDTGGGGDAA